MTRPLLIDPADGPCEICAERADKKVVKDADGKKLGLRCDDCGCTIPVYRDMGGSGFESHSIDHLHLGSIGKLGARNPIKRELCKECYLRDFAKVYPTYPLPVLPPTFVEAPKAPVPDLAARAINLAQGIEHIAKE